MNYSKECKLVNNACNVYIYDLVLFVLSANSTYGPYPPKAFSKPPLLILKSFFYLILFFLKKEIIKSQPKAELHNYIQEILKKAYMQFKIMLV